MENKKEKKQNYKDWNDYNNNLTPIDWKDYIKDQKYLKDFTDSLQWRV